MSAGGDEEQARAPSAARLRAPPRRPRAGRARATRIIARSARIRPEDPRRRLAAARDRAGAPGAQPGFDDQRADEDRRQDELELAVRRGLEDAAEPPEHEDVDQLPGRVAEDEDREVRS